MATDSTNLPQGETTLVDSGSDMTGSELDLTAVQLAQAAPAEWVDLPKGNVVILLPVQPGQVVKLPTDSAGNLLAKFGPEGNLAIVVDGRTIILQGFLKANDQSPIKIVTDDGDNVDVAELIAATDPSLDIQTAAGPATGGQGDGPDGSGIYVPFAAGPGLGGLLAAGILDPTALQYRLIDDEYKEFTLEENGLPQSIEIVPDDGRPTAEDGAFLLDEDELATGTAGGPGDDLGSLTSSGTVVVDFGPDGPRAVDPIVMTGVVNGSESGLFALTPGSTAQGAPILLQLDPPAGGVQVLHGYVGLTKYFTITLDTTTGHFEVEQLEPLWHPVTGTEDNVLLNVQFSAFDLNGDSLSETLHLSFDDDSPTITPCHDEEGNDINLLVNGSFEDLGKEDGGLLENGSWGVFSKIPGWTSGNAADSSKAGLEIQNDGAVPQIDAKDGEHYAELDSDALNPGDAKPGSTNASIYQDVDTQDGNNYVLSFSYSPRTGIESTDGIEVWFDGVKIATIDSGDVGEWKEYTFVVEAGAADGTPDSSRLEFKAVGTADSLGGFIDDVSLTACALVDEDLLPNGIEGGPGDDGVIGTTFDGSLGVNFGADGANSIAFSEAGQPNLTSGGQVVNYDWQGAPGGLGTLIAYIGGDPNDPNNQVFKVEVTSLEDGGQYTFTLLKALDHPDTNNNPADDATDDGQGSFEDNLIFELEFTAIDGDGDPATGHLKVNVDDDSPTATCDFDCVTEGTHGEGELNFASGNVVTGNPATAFDDDANSLDGNEDHPGADQPYTISKLAHEGDTYTLVDEGGGNFHAEKNGVEIDGSGDESFDGSTLTIKTAEGGTFEIVMVSPTQSEVGDYKYTVPADADHDIDHPVGPDVEDSTTFGNIGTWVDAFHDAGIDVSAIGGSNGQGPNGGLVIKNPVTVDPTEGVPGEVPVQYAGIGVKSGNGDESEVDRDGSRVDPEGLKLKISNSEFPGGVTNATLTIGALFDGKQFDAGNQEILRWEIWNNGFPVGSGQILGDYDGLVTLDIDTDGQKFDEIRLYPVDNGASGGNNSDFLLVNAEICCPQNKFTEEFDYTLRDADGDEASATLKVDVKDTQPELPHCPPEISVCINVDEDGLPNGIGNSDSPLDAPGNSASTVGNIPFTPGFDPVTIELSVGFGGDTGLETVHGDNVFAAWDAASQTLIGYIEGTDPSDPANQVFKMTITDPQTGEFKFELLQPVEHPNTEFFGIIDDTENLFDLSFIVNVQIEDKDCDVITTKVKVTIDDDMPVITECHDEQGNDINLLVNGSFENIGGKADEDGGVLDRGSWGVFSEIPGWTSGNATDPSKAGLEIQNDGAVPQIDAKDGEHYAELDSDALNPGDAKPGSTNASIYQDVDTQDGNNYVLSFSYSPREGNPATDGIEVWFDGVKVATIDSGNVGEWKEYTFVVEAGADPADSTPDSSRLEFKAVGTSDSLGGFIDDVSLTACALVDEDLLPNGIEGGPGDDGVIGTTFNGSLGVNFGADGGKSIAFFGEDNLQPNLKSGGQEVNYEWVSAPGGLGILIAYTGGNPFSVNNQVFKVQVTSLEDGGQYTFTLLKPLDHPDTNNNPADNNSDNGKGSYEDNLIFELKFKATDNDGDTVTGHLQVNVDDDSPTITNGTGSFSLATDETLGGGADVPGGGTTAENDETLVPVPGVISAQVAGTVIGASSSGAAGLFNGQYGADGPGSSVYSLTFVEGANTGMIDTATNTAVTLHAGLNGVVLAKNAGGDVVFAFSIDGSGNVTMVQYRAVNHGAEEAAPGEHDEVTSMDPGVLGVTLKVTDYDGDAVSLTRDISGSISVDDDGPHATCDYDHVTEGPGNFAAGNVVTGIDAALLDQDGNLSDGNADNPGRDKPYTISKLSHGGHDYSLIDNGDGTFSVQKDAEAPTPLGADGKLTITTAEGATFEIVMVSNTQSDVGEYKYTPGPNPIHAEDVLVGPADIAATRSGAFDSVGEWQSAFTTGGINLVANGGSLAIKNIDVDPKTGFGGAEDYRGIGVNTGIDNAEVDTQHENLTLEFDAVKFPGGVNNAEVLIGALFNGVQFDSGSQEILKWEAYDGVTLIASGQIVGDHDGLVTLDIDTAGNFNKIVLTPLNNGAGNNGNNSDFLLINVEVCEQEPVKEEFDYTLRDGDGDESTATLKICVEDTFPTIPTQTPPLSILIDEDGLNPAGVGNTTSPFDAEEDHTGPNAPADDAKFIGTIPFAAGADPVTIELSVAGGDTGLDTVDGKNVHAAWDAATSTLIGYIEGTDPSNAANQVFKMTVTDHTTGAFTFELLQPVEHSNTDPGNQNNNTENGQDREFTVQVQIEDADCDVAFTSVKVTIDDDMPVVTANYCGSFLLAVDESLDGNSSTSGGDDVLPNPGTTQEDDEDHFTMPSPLNSLTTIGEAQANAANLFSVDYGADGPGGDPDYSLVIKNGGVTGLIDTQSGTPITLSFFSADVVVGRDGFGNAVLAFHIDEDTGLVSMAQYRAVNHGAEPADGPLGNHDEVIGFVNQVLSVKLEVSDNDQDFVSLERDISNLITIDDDGPKTELTLKHNAKFVLDETVGGAPNDNDEAAQAPGNDIGYAKLTAGNLFNESTNFGTDGAAAANSKVFSLLINGSDVSGLVDSQTDQGIVLVNNLGVIEGHVGNAAGALAFTISVNGSGDVTVSQFRAVEHDNPGDHDESSSPEIMDPSKVLLKLTVTDRDGDKAESTVDIGAIIKFEDDGPKANADIDSVAEDSGFYAIGNVVTAVGNTPAFGDDANGTDGVADAPGQDGLKSITWTNLVDVPADPIDYVQGTYGKLYVDSTGAYKYDLDDNHPALATLDNGETLTEEFGYSIKDGDNDTASSKLTITINGHTDAFPPTAENATAFVDEDGLPAGLGDNQPGDDNADAAPDTVAGEAVFHDLTLPVNWNGNNGTITLSDGDWSALRTIDNHTIAVNGVGTSLLKGIDSVTLEVVFEVQIINQVTGEYEVRLLKALQHPDSNNNPADNATDDGTGRYEDNLTIPVNVKYTNIAGEANQSISIIVDDDVPVAGLTTCGTITLAVDETLGGGADVAPNPGTTAENDETLFLMPAALSVIGSTIGEAQTSAAGLFTSNAGADGEGSHAYGLTITGAGATGLIDTATNTAITLVAGAGGVIEGRANGGVGPVVFAFSVDASTGQVSMAQYRAINHGNEEAAPGNHDEEKSMNSGVLSVTYTITDKDGDSATAQKDISGNIKFDDDGPKVSTTTGGFSLAVDETLGGGADVAPNPGTTAENDETLFVMPAALSVIGSTIGEAQTSAAGLFTSNAGADGQQSAVYSLSITGGGATGMIDTATNTAITLVAGAGGVVEGRANSGAGPVVFAFSVDAGTGLVSMAQYRAINHGSEEVAPGNHDEVKFMNSGVLSVTYTVTDKDGDSDAKSKDISGSISIDDDGPKANPLTKSILADTGVDTNLLITLDISGSMNQASGMTDLNKLEAAIASIKELIEQYDALGNVKVRLVTFSSNADEEGAVWMTVDEVKDVLDGLSPDGSTNYDEALTDAIAAFGDSGKIVGAQNVAYFLSDGHPNRPVGDEGIDAGEETTWINFLKNNDINSFALGFGAPGDVDQSEINPIAYNGLTETNTNGQVITDLNLLTATLVSTVTPPVSGNVKTDGGNKNGTDVPGIVSKVTFGGNTFEFNGTTITRTAGSLPFTSALGLLNFSTPNGTLQINMNSGAYTYALLADAAANDLFGYTLTDADGDSATSTLQISAAVSDIAPIVRDDYIIAGHNDGGGDEAIIVPDKALLWNDTDANGDPITVGNTFTNVANLVSVSHGGGNVTITDGQNGGSFTYTGTANTKSDTGDVVVDRSQEGDDPLEGNGLDNIIISDGSDDTLNGYEGNDVLLGNGGNDELNGDTGRDWLVGGDGKDTLNGGTGNDLLEGGAGNDTLDGEAGDDALVGGAGNDSYQLDNEAGDNDTVYITSSLDGNDVINTFGDGVNNGGAASQDFVNLDQLFDSLGVASGARSGRVQISDGGSDALVTVDLTGNGFGAGDIVITLNGIGSIANLTKGTSATDDIQLGTL